MEQTLKPRIEMIIDYCTHENYSIFLVPDGFVKQCTHCKKIEKIK